MMVMADCEPCEGTGLMLECGGRCGSCNGLGIVQKPLTDEQADDVFFSHLPAGWTKERARALLSRMRTGRPVVIPEVIWSPYPDGAQ